MNLTIATTATHVSAPPPASASAAMPEATGPKRRGRPPKPPGERIVKPPRKPRAIGEGATQEARRQAVAILEVLAGIRGAPDAARSLDLHLARYYQIETRAINALVDACEPRSIGRPAAQPDATPESPRESLKLRYLSRELLRYQSLVRVMAKGVGVAPPGESATANKATSDTNAKTRRGRKAGNRVEAVVRKLRPAPSTTTAPPATTKTTVTEGRAT